MVGGPPEGDRSAREAVDVGGRPPADPGGVTRSTTNPEARDRILAEFWSSGVYIRRQSAPKRGALPERSPAVAIYRYQCVSVGMWRGKIKRWNTTFHAADPNETSIIKGAMQATGWKAPGDVAGACSGGVASIACYNAAGGPPVSNTIYFDWQTPSTWIPYTSTAWASVPAATLLDAAGESAAIVVGKLPGLSVTGKPKSVRKYLHAIPSRTAASYLDPDIDAAAAAAIKAQFPLSIMLTPAGLAPTTTVVNPWYGNHQRVRGRRRTVKAVAAQSFASGVIVGAQPSTSGGEPFRSGQ